MYVRSKRGPHLLLVSSIGMTTPGVPIIFISGRGNIRITVEAMKAGAVDFLVKPFSDDVSLRSIRESLERSRAAVDRMVLVVSGLLNKQVARELGIGETTVKAHRGQVMQKK